MSTHSKLSERTHYDFSKFTNRELCVCAIKPPSDMEAADWKRLARELAGQLLPIMNAVDRR